MINYKINFKPEWNYDTVCNNVRRYSFSDKMKLAHFHSRKLIDRLTPEEIVKCALPHEIESFVMIAIKKGEWRDNKFTEREFEKCITGIRNYHHPCLFSSSEFADWFFMLSTATQFDFQTNPIYRLSRFIEYFTYRDNDIDMEVIFHKKFGVDYLTFISPIVYIWFKMIKESQEELSLYELSRLKILYDKTFSLLTLSRDQYIQKLDDISTDEHDYIYCLRPSYSWPFIEENGVIYNPTPHLILRASTSSLMYRLTEENDELRNKIGKNVLESYLYKIIFESGVFSEVMAEQEYGDGKRTLDVMASIGEDIVCFDSKSFSPKINIRTFSQAGVENAVDRLAKCVFQVYSHIHGKFGVEYDYLNVKAKSDKTNIFGIVVISDNPYIHAEKIYYEAARQLNIDIKSDEYKWMCGHIGIVDINFLEEQLFSRDNFQEALHSNEKSGQFNDHWFASGEKKKSSIFPDFMKKNIEVMYECYKAAMEKISTIQ